MLQNQSARVSANANQRDLAYIASVLDGIRYGSIEIVIHDARIVQIERREKVRFDRER